MGYCTGGHGVWHRVPDTHHRYFYVYRRCGLVGRQYRFIMVLRGRGRCSVTNRGWGWCRWDWELLIVLLLIILFLIFITVEGEAPFS
ncbi:hypothetical protein MAMMFC1_01570 [Methylomusa anaerophila]|uniref:Uncharacterized protein n=1 Tax=Methylomusa anaerophila TaxID=1930071 RepID=A0A348AIK5_9FIRM|nr:hypothetical protein MAMMFC1_01570 [Methylomusa anaerophila]